MSLGIVFPGQGSQAVGMLVDVASVHPVIDTYLVQAGERIGIDLLSTVRDGPEALLNRTDITQPAILAVSIALWRLLVDAGARPIAFAGHSLGEYSALVAAGSISFDAAVHLVHLRGELMQRAVPIGEGAMAAILGLDDAVIAAECEREAGVVSPANYNAPGQTVIAGASGAVQRVVEACRDAGARRAVMLDVSVPSHCALMMSMRDEFAQALDEVSIVMPSPPVVQNVEAAPAESVQGVREQLLAQLANPVRWTDCIAALRSMGVQRVIECGPGKVLSGLVKRIDRGLAPQATGDLAGLDAALETLAASGSAP